MESYIWIHIGSWRKPGAHCLRRLYTALQLGTVDGCENAIATLYTQRFYEVQNTSVLPVISTVRSSCLGRKHGANCLRNTDIIMENARGHCGAR